MLLTKRLVALRSLGSFRSWRCLSRIPVHIASSSSPHHPVPPVPLCLRPALFEEPLEELLSWRNAMQNRIAQIGDTFETNDGGPGKDELLREITWVLEDIVAEVLEPALAAPGGGWGSCNWRHLEVELRHAKQHGKPLDQLRLRLRAPVQQLYALWQRRLEAREPFQYLISTAHWREFILSVSPGVLIPRPETEIFPDLVAAAVAADPRLAALPWADLGTGSGAIAIGAAAALRKHNKDAVVWAVDLSPVAAAHAEFNASLAGLSKHVRVAQGSWYQPLGDLKGQLGGVLSNPPYIPQSQMPGLQLEVKSHEPWSALDGGPGPGLESLQAVCCGAVEMLHPGGLLALETAGREQAEAVLALLLQLTPDSSKESPAGSWQRGTDHSLATSEQPPDAAFENASIVDDCYGIGRFVTASRTSH